MAKVKQFINQKIEVWLLGIFSLVTAILTLPNLFTKNDLTSWDLVGHIFTTEFGKDNLYPNFIGWNPFHSLGYSQGAFYPSLIHYFIGFLDIIYNNTDFWIKLLFAIALLSLPFCIFFFAKKIKNKLKSDHLVRDNLALVIIAQLTSLLIIFAPQLYGGSVKSFLQIGLLSNFLTLPVLFIYLGLIIDLDYEDLLNRKTFISSVLLSFLLLSHLVNGPIALIFTLAFWIMGFFNRNSFWGKRIFSSYFLVLAISFLSTAYFFLPYLMNSYLISPIENTIQFSKTTVFLAFIVFIANFGILKFIRPVSKRAFLLINSLILVLIGFSVIEATLIYLKSDFSLGIVQPYRIFSVAIFIGFTFFLVGLWTVISEKKWDLTKFLRSEKVLTYIQIPVILVLALGLFKLDIGTKDYGHLELNQANISSMKGNILSLITLDDTYYLYRDVIYDPVSINKNIFFLNTQFNESSYLNAFTSALRDNIYYTGKDLQTEKPKYPETYHLSQDKVYHLLNLMNVKYLVFTDESHVQFNLCSNTFEYGSIQPSSKKIYACEVILPKLDITKIAFSNKENWNRDMYDFSKSNENYNISEDIGLSHDLKALPTYYYKGGINWSSNYQSFTVDTTNLTDLMIIPIQYNPHWHAYLINDDGTETEISVNRAAPNLIVVLNAGRIVFRYQFSNYERILKYTAYLTVATNLILILLGNFSLFLYSREKSKLNKEQH